MPYPPATSRPASGGDPRRDQGGHRVTCGVCRDPDRTTFPVLISSGDLSVSIPLCEHDAAGLMHSIDTWLAVSEATATATTAQGRRLQEGEAVTAIREWALTHGYPVARSGSLSQPIIAAYRRAHATLPSPRTDP